MLLVPRDNTYRFHSQSARHLYRVFEIRALKFRGQVNGLTINWSDLEYAAHSLNCTLRSPP